VTVRRDHAGFSLADLVVGLAALTVLAALLLPVVHRSARAARLDAAEERVQQVRMAYEEHRTAEGSWPGSAPPGRVPAGLERYLPPGTGFEGEGFVLEARRWRTVEEPARPTGIPEMPDETPGDTLPLPSPTVEVLAGLSLGTADPALLTALLSTHPDDSFVQDTVWILVFPQRPHP